MSCLFVWDICGQSKDISYREEVVVSVQVMHSCVSWRFDLQFLTCSCWLFLFYALTARWFGRSCSLGGEGLLLGSVIRGEDSKDSTNSLFKRNSFLETPIGERQVDRVTRACVCVCVGARVGGEGESPCTPAIIHVCGKVVGLQLCKLELSLFSVWRVR